MKITTEKLIKLEFADISDGYYCVYKLEVKHPWKKSYIFSIQYLDKDHWIWIEGNLIVDLYTMEDLYNLYKGLFKKDLNENKKN